jgi:hypothetical protein
MRGHGTYTKNDVLYASVAGIVQRVNKLISVLPPKTKYQGEHKRAFDHKKILCLSTSFRETVPFSKHNLNCYLKMAVVWNQLLWKQNWNLKALIFKSEEWRCELDTVKWKTAVSFKKNIFNLKTFSISGEIGDVVVGRVTEVQQKRWKVDINCRLDAGNISALLLREIWLFQIFS